MPLGRSIFMDDRGHVTYDSCCRDEEKYHTQYIRAHVVEEMMQVLRDVSAALVRGSNIAEIKLIENILAKYERIIK